MKALSACLYCNKKKDCAESVQAHTFSSPCFSYDDENIGAALKKLQSLSELRLNVNISSITNSIAELLIKQSISVTKLAQKIITDGCASVCFHAGESCGKETECFACEEPCPCRDCWDGEKLKIDWSKLNET